MAGNFLIFNLWKMVSSDLNLDLGKLILPQKIPFSEIL